MVLPSSYGDEGLIYPVILPLMVDRLCWSSIDVSEALVVENQPIVRLGLQMLLDLEPDVDIIGVSSTAAEAIHFVDDLQPNIVPMDIELLDRSGIDTAEKISRRHPDIAVTALIIYEDGEYVGKMFSIRASGYVTKRAAPDKLLTMIREAAVRGMNQ